MKQLLLILFCFCQIAFSQEKKEIGGKITAENGQPIPGTTIVEKSNSKIGTNSDFDGSFVLKVSKDATELEISSMGYKPKTVAIQGSLINVTLEEEENKLKEVVVKGFGSVDSRARVRVQSIQSLPETTVAINAQTIEANGINNIQSFTSQISNVTFNQAQQPGVNFLTVRGISQIRNGESPVAVVIDGMTLPDASAMNMSLYDLELLEFVKGPQGTLYGKNAIAGAINITTKDPTNKNKTKITLSGGNGGLFGARLSSSGAVIKDKLFYSVSGGFRSFDGLINNTFLNEKVDFSDEYNIRAKLKYVLSPKWSITYVQDNFNVDAGGNYYVTKPDIFVAGPPLADNDYSHEPFGDVQGDSNLSNSLSSLKVEGNFSKMRFQSVTSFNATKRYYIGENDYSQYAFSKVSQESNSDTFSQEFRLTSKDSKETKFNYTVGTLFQNSQRYLNTSTFLNKTYYTGFVDASAANANYSTVPSVGNDDNNTIQTVAGFVFFDYKLTSKLTASAGVRVDYDQLKNDAHITNTTSENNITVWQPKFSLSYQVVENVLGYANYGKGYRSGGFNSAPTAKFGKEYQPEFTNNYEVGLKTSFWNNRLIFNNAFYIIDFENQQQYTFIPVTPAVLGIYNFEKSRISGFESELKFKATNNIDFFAGIGFNNGEIIKGTYNQLTKPGLDSFKYDTFEVIDVSGNTSPYTIESTINAGVNGNFTLNDKSSLGFFINMDTRGVQYWDPLEEYKQEPYTLVNARVNANISNFGITLWANNILNTEFNTEFFPTAEFGFNNLRFPNTPTTIGIDLSYKF